MRIATAFCAAALGVLAGCVSTEQSAKVNADWEALNAKRPQCAKAAGITGQYSVTTEYYGVSVVQVFQPGAGVSAAQAAKANACMRAE